MRISIVGDAGIDKTYLENFIQCAAAQLTRELAVWHRRLQEIVDLQLMTDDELDETIERLRSVQPWYIYASRNGGLFDSESTDGAADLAKAFHGVIPCSGAQHHGVGWWMNHGVRQVGLITSHRAGGTWNWDEDIGHEASHAAFGPVPLFSQRYEQFSRQNCLSSSPKAEGGLSREAIAHICYLNAELVAAYVRGEQRFTSTGLPGLADADELAAFLRGAHRLLPAAHFCDVEPLVRGCDMPIQVWSGSASRYIGAAALRFAQRSVDLVNLDEPPDEDWFRAL